MIIIHGTMRRLREAGGGTFFCPSCCTPQPYTVLYDVEVKTIFFIPLFETRIVEEWLICRNCHDRHGPEVLRYTPAEILERVNPWHCFTCRRQNPDDREHCWHCGVSRYKVPD